MLLSLLLACGQSFHTENDAVIVEDDFMVTLADGDSNAPNSFVAGTRMCAEPRPNAEGVDARDDWGACFEQTLAVGEFDADGCATFPDVGDVRWDFAAQTCDLGAVTSDGVTIHVVDPATLAVALDPGYEPLVEQAIADGTAKGEIPDDWTHESGTPWRVFSDGYFTFYPRATIDSVPVAFRNDRDVWAFEAIAGEVPGWEALPSVGGGTLWPALDSDNNFGIVFGESTFPLGEIIGVDASEAASIDIVVISTVDEAEPDANTPAYARAIVRNAEGTPLYGANVVWTASDGLTVQAGRDHSGYAPGPDYAILTADCVANDSVGVERSGTITAEYAGLSVTNSVTWTPGPSSSCGEAMKVDAVCTECCCASGTDPRSASAFLFILLALATRRRR